MKGMQKIKRGKSFSGVVLYVLKPGSHHRTVPEVIGGNMTGDCSQELIDEFNLTKELRSDVAKPVWQSLFRILCKYLFSEVAVQAVTELDNKAAHCHTPVPQWHRPFL